MQNDEMKERFYTESEPFEKKRRRSKMQPKKSNDDKLHRWCITEMNLQFSAWSGHEFGAA